MAEPAFRRWTVDEFLDWEREQAEKHEFLDGVVRMMVGGTLRHHLVAGNLSRQLGLRLEGRPCFVFSEGPKVRTGENVLYPDVVVACGSLDLSKDVIEAPTLIAEVLSPSTAQRDRNEKWRAYQQLESLRYYLILSQDAAAIEVFVRRPEGWEPRKVTGLDSTLVLPDLDLEVPLAAIYAGTAVTA